MNYTRHKSTTEILSDLVRIDTSQPKGNEMDAIIYIKSLLSPYNLKMEEIDHSNNRGSLVVTLDGKTEESLAFIGHLDTVTTGNHENWSRSPFSAHVEKGTLFGRGAADMKAGVTAMIQTLLYFCINQEKPQKTILFIFTADEEKKGIGIESVVEKGFFHKVTEIIVPEPTQLKIGICEKGTFWIKVEVKGKSSHASMPELGINSIEIAMNIIDKYRAVIPDDKNIYLKGNTMAVTQINGGGLTNVIPSNVVFELDIRLVQEHSIFLLEELEKIIAEQESKFPGVAISYEILNNRIFVSTDKENPLVENIQKSCVEENIKTDICGLNFYTDVSQVITKHNIPFVIIGPGMEGDCHVVNEKVKLSQIDDAIRLYLNYVRRN